MRELINMVVVLTGISLASGGLLASLRENTQERIDQQVLEFVKGPSVRAVFKDAANDPIATRFQLKDGEAVRTFFVGEIEGAFRGVALEADRQGLQGGDRARRRHRHPDRQSHRDRGHDPLGNARTGGESQDRPGLRRPVQGGTRVRPRQGHQGRGVDQRHQRRDHHLPRGRRRGVQRLHHL